MSRKHLTGLLAVVGVAALLAGCATAPTPAQLGTLPAAAPSPMVDDMPSLAPGDLSVFAASSLTEAFTEIGDAFTEEHPGANVVFNFAGSQILRTQIEEGAAADVFASANMAEMDALVAAGHISRHSPQTFAENRLVVITADGVSVGRLEDLAQPGLKIVLAAEEVPVGRYSRQALENLNERFGATYAEAVMANVVSLEENVRQVLAKVALGEADAGLVYSTDAATEPTLTTIAIENSHNVPASYPIAVLTGAPRADLAQVFVDFVKSPRGQAILASHGFLPGEG
jgi:molybdate transport system substrate-binding protein